MENEQTRLKISEKYQPLFDFPKAKGVIEGKSNAIPLDYARKLSKVDTIVITGGRNSGKSFVVSLAAANWCQQYMHRILFTRYTLTSAEDTIIPDFMEKVEILQYTPYFKVRKDRIVSKNNKGKVVFKGIKTSSGNQSASLKSLKDFSCFLVDEAEEIPDLNTWKKIYLSIRVKDVQNVSILSLNPSDKEHWIYKEFYENRGIKGGHNGIVGNVMYIHTTYLDLDRDLIADNVWREFKRMKEKEPEEYATVVMGKWRDNIKGSLFFPKDFQYFSMDDIDYNNIKKKLGFIDVADKGVDYLSFPIGYEIGNFLYIVDWYFTDESSKTTIDGSAEYITYHNLDYTGIETNGMGSIFASEVNDRIPDQCSIIEVNQSSDSNKHTRILMNAGGTRLKIVFRNDVEFGSMYDLGLRQFFKYNKDKTLNDWDDAADSLTGLKLIYEDLKEY